MILNMLFRSSFPTLLQSPINCGAFAMIMGLILVPLVSLITKSPEKAAVDEMFSCYETQVVVSAKKSLNE